MNGRLSRRTDFRPETQKLCSHSLDPVMLSMIIFSGCLRNIVINNVRAYKACLVSPS